MEVLGQFKSDFIQLSNDNCTLRLPRFLWSIKTPVEFWEAAERNRQCTVSMSIWTHQIRSNRAAQVDKNTVADFLGDAYVAVGGASGSEGAINFGNLIDASVHRIKVQSMAPLLLSTSEVLAKVSERDLVLKDELNTRVVEMKVSIGSCDRSAVELDALLDEHMLEALHHRRLAQKLLDIVDYARHNAIVAPSCLPHELEALIDSLKASAAIWCAYRCTVLTPGHIVQACKKTVERTILIREWSESVACR
jgi:hypothetical protein